jgi:hypothetical protein
VYLSGRAPAVQTQSSEFKPQSHKKKKKKERKKEREEKPKSINKCM